jgi:1,2-diacylglycerol 3-alpha-glucosyltransferase
MFRIGQFCDAFLPVLDGVTQCVVNYASILTERGESCTVFSPSAPGYTDEFPYQVLRFGSLPLAMRPPYRLGLPHLDLEFQLRLRKLELDLVHAHSPFTAGQIALETAKKRRIPIVATFHSKYRDDLGSNIPLKSIVDLQVKNIVKFYCSVDEVWAPNRSTAGTLREYGYDGPIEIVENGCDMRPDEDVASYRAKGNAVLGTRDDEIVLLYVGQIILEKNLEFLVRVLGALKRMGRRFRAVFVGQGYARKRLEELIEEENLSDTVTFAGVVADRESLKAYYARADLFMFPSVYDNAPLVVKEVSAFGVPTVFIKGTNAAENVEHGRNGFVSEPDVDQFASVSAAALDDPALRRAAGEGAKKTFYRPWESVVDEVIERYRAIINRTAVRL